MRVLGISGSLREGSYNTRLLEAAAALMPPSAELVVFDGLRDIPPYDADLDGPLAPLAVRRLRAEVAEADAVLIATPEYNSSLPGQLKNALDWASRPYDENVFRNKPVAVIGASTGMFGAVWAQAEGRKVLGAMGARVLDEELPVGHAAEALAGDGPLDPELRDALEALAGRLAATVEERLALAA